MRDSVGLIKEVDKTQKSGQIIMDLRCLARTVGNRHNTFAPKNMIPKARYTPG